MPLLLIARIPGVRSLKDYNKNRQDGFIVIIPRVFIPMDILTLLHLMTLFQVHCQK